MDQLNQRLLPEYSVDVLSYLLTLERSQVLPGDFLRQQTETQVWMRDKLVKWVVSLCTEMHMSTQGTQLALTIINQFLSKVKTPKSALQLVGVVGMMLAAKYEEGFDYTLEHAYNHAARLYPKQDIITAELYCLEKLEWRMHYPTAAEFTRQLLFITGVQYDFSRIIERTDQLTMMCYIDYTLSQYSSLSIAIVCTLSILEQFRQLKFRDEWLEFLFQKVPLEREELDQCRRALLDYLERDQTERLRMGTLSKESFSVLLTSAHSKLVKSST